METAGQKLRLVRERLGLTTRDVEAASQAIAARRGSEQYAVQISRLSDIETKGVTPSIFRLYTLAAIYRRDFTELLSWYEVDLSNAAADGALIEIPRSHPASGSLPAAVNIPVKMDPSFNLAKTTNIGRMIEAWGVVPLTYLNGLVNAEYTYAYIGSEDFTMYPLLLPGSFAQVDESKDKKKIVEGGWRSEYERPIYFVEMRDAFVCCWCSLEGDKLILQPHPLSPTPVRIVKYQQDAEVLGQVVGVAMRLDQWRTVGNGSAPKAARRSRASGTACAASTIVLRTKS